jgi:hypothetical protein
MVEFKKNLISLKNAIDNTISKDIDLSKEIEKDKMLYDFKEKQKEYYIKAVENALKFVKQNSLELNQLIKFDNKNTQGVNELLELMAELESKDINELKKVVTKMITIADQMNFPKTDLEKRFPVPDFIPLDIKEDITADINELNKCFNTGCFRSVVILCGRLLETALHRKYFETTGKDILEKNPGIGLGNLIGKLAEKNVKFDPGLTQQIHLINQVRVFSVHKKQEAFYPSKDQANAMVLYTLDVLGKMFKK